MISARRGCLISRYDAEVLFTKVPKSMSYEQHDDESALAAVKELHKQSMMYFGAGCFMMVVACAAGGFFIMQSSLFLAVFLFALFFLVGGFSLYQGTQLLKCPQCGIKIDDPYKRGNPSGPHHCGRCSLLLKG